MTSTKKELLSGIFYSGISKYSGIIISLIVAGVLARLIAPEEFGIVAIATVIISFFGFFSDLGIAPAIIQNKELTKQDLNKIFSFTVWTGIGVSILFYFFSFPISWFYKSHSVLTICQLLSLNLFFAAISIVPNALLYKKKQFKFIAIRSLTIQITGGTIAVSAALLGAGIYALIINPIFSSLFLFIISYRKEPQKILPSMGLDAVKKIFSFSCYQFMFNVINYFSRNLDKLLIGKYMTMTDLGYYEKSYRLMMLPLQNITQVISPVMHPVFSNFQNNLQKLSSSYERVIHLLALIGFPLSVFLYFNAYEITIIIFGDKWIPSVPIFQILSLSVGFQLVLSTSGSIFQAANDTKSLFICGVISTILNVAGILIGVFILQTLESIAWCICITFATNFFICYLWMYQKTLNRNIFFLFKEIRSSIVLTFIEIIVLYPIYKYYTFSTPIVNIFLSGSIFIVVFLLYVQLSKEFDVVLFIKRKFNF